MPGAGNRAEEQPMAVCDEAVRACLRTGGEPAPGTRVRDDDAPPRECGQARRQRGYG